MKWTSIRDQFPNCWVLVEALFTHSISNKKTIDEMSVISIISILKRLGPHKKNYTSQILLVNFTSSILGMSLLKLLNNHSLGSKVFNEN